MTDASEGRKVVFVVPPLQRSPYRIRSIDGALRWEDQKIVRMRFLDEEAAAKASAGKGNAPSRDRVMFWGLVLMAVPGLPTTIYLLLRGLRWAFVLFA